MRTDVGKEDVENYGGETRRVICPMSDANQPTPLMNKNSEFGAERGEGGGPEVSGGSLEKPEPASESVDSPRASCGCAPVHGNAGATRGRSRGDVARRVSLVARLGHSRGVYCWSKLEGKQSMNTDEIVKAVAASFPSFGGGKGSNGWNPIADALKDKPAQFAAGADIKAVVNFVLERAGIGRN